uniref:Uncharacterized protein n=1 Tax=Panagrolaimus superbus TaxID=310955 RepID=A0A914YNR3_9BILA
MSINDIIDFTCQAESIFTITYILGHKSMTYEQFNLALQHACGIDIEKLARDFNHFNGRTFLHSRGFQFDENMDLAIPFLGEALSNENCNSEPPIEDKPKAVHIFDGDESKLHPGMYVKIATGVIHALPAIPQFDHQNEHTRRVQSKAGANYTKKLRYIVETHAKMMKTLAIMKKQ